MQSELNITNRYGLSRTGEWVFVDGDRKFSFNLPALCFLKDYIDRTDPEYDIFCKENDILIDKLPQKSNDDYNFKLMLIKNQNPLISDFNDTGIGLSVPTSQAMTLHSPGTILFPESISEFGIDYDSINPVVNLNSETQTNDNTFNIDHIFGNKTTLSSGSGLLIINNGFKLMKNPRSLVKNVLTLEHRLSPEKLLYLPGIATVNNLSILVYLGIDLFDNIQCILQSRMGNLMTSSGLIAHSERLDGICYCPGCLELERLRENRGGDLTNEQLFNSLLKHNHLALRSELALIKTALNKGTLRELIEQRMVSEPYLTELIRILDIEHYAKLEKYFPIQRRSRFLVTSHDALTRVEVVRFRNRIINRYRKPEGSELLVLLPCSAKKPYSKSKSHKLFRSAMDDAVSVVSERSNSHKIKSSSNFRKGRNQLRSSFIHELIVTSPLGLVPRELELVYPAQQYDIPVTGNWFKDELDMITGALDQYLAINEYKTIIIHLSRSLSKSIFNHLKNNDNHKIHNLSQIIQTCVDTPTSKSSLVNLTENLSELLLENSDGSNKIKKSENLKTILEQIARYQFDMPGLKLLRDSKIVGRYPNLKIFSDGIQQGMLTAARGLISLTLAGAQRLASQDGFKYLIEIDDFIPRGSVMNVGVLEASDHIRAGDEVVVCYQGSVRAVGQAVLSGPEMAACNRGAAVKVRHHIK